MPQTRQYPRAVDQEGDGASGGVGSGGGGSHYPSMDLLLYRLEQGEKRTEALASYMERIEQSLADIKLSLATAPTRYTIAGWAIAIVVAVVAVGGLLLQSSSNQLAAFQAGLSAVQTVIAAPTPMPTPAQQGQRH